jgi:hypothetical protein
MRPPCIGEKHPATLQLVEEATSGETKGLGAVYWRSLSAVAHSQAQGLMSHAQPIAQFGQESDDGVQLQQ